MQKITQLTEKYGIYSILPILGLMLSAPQSLQAQEDLEYVAEPTVVLEDQAATELLGTEELAELVGPIALYPDDLVAIVLPAATYPLQIAQAADFLERLKNDASLTSDPDWDDSIVALLNYPEVVAMMNDDLTWTWQLGNAVLNQQADVVQAIGGFRDQAYAAGNLKSDDYQNVVVEENAIEITPVDPEVIYVPYYEPAQVVVVQRAPVYHYYPYAYPVYYYPYAYGYSFSSGYFWGVTTAFTIGWHSHYIQRHHYYYPSHPYYSRHYYPRHYTRYYPPGRNPVRPAPYRANYDRHDRYSGGDRWQSQNHQGSRPVRWSDSGRSGSRTASRVDGNVARANSNRSRSTAQISSEYRNALAQDSSLRQVRGSDSRATRGTGWKERDLQANSSRDPGNAVSSNSHDQRSWRRPGKETANTSQSDRQGAAVASAQNATAANTRAGNPRVASTRNPGDSAQLQRQLRQGLEQDTRQRQTRAQDGDTRSQAARASSDSSRSRSSNANTSRSGQIGNQVRQGLQRDSRQRTARTESGNTGGRTLANQGRNQAANRSTSRETSRGQASDNSRSTTREQSAAPQVRSQPAPQVRTQPAPQVRSQPAPQVRSQPAPRSQPEAKSESRPAPRQESRRESSGGKSRSNSSRQKSRGKPR